MSRHEKPTPSQWTAFKNLILLHVIGIGIWALHHYNIPLEERERISNEIRNDHYEQDCYLLEMQEEWERKLKEFENAPLHEGRKTSMLRTDILSRLKVREVGYGVTNAEIALAKSYGILAPCAKLPTSLTKKQADKWFRTVTFPTYLRCVEKAIGDRALSPEQKLALVSFCHNLGEGNLRKLLRHPDEKIAEQMVRFVYAGGRIRLGLQKRRAWEAAWWEAGLQKPALLASR